MSFAAAEADRMLAAMLSIGRVTSVDGGAATARVEIGPVKSPPLPVGQLAAGDRAFWWMPAVGDQVLVAAPSGDLAQGIIVCGLYAQNAPSADVAVPKIALAGGKMVIDGDVEITGKVTIAGTLDVDGKLTVRNALEAEGDVSGGGTSLRNHVHGGVIRGSANTDGPV